MRIGAKKNKAKQTQFQTALRPKKKFRKPDNIKNIIYRIERYILFAVTRARL